jgi:hypothetical protein
MSSYIYVSNNPLIYIDPFGMDLYLANNKHIRQAMNDIIGLINSSKFQGSVTFNFTDTENGKKVDVDFGELSSETIKNNEGLSLLNDLTSASENYLYEVGESFSGRHRETGEETKKYKLASSRYSDSFVGNLSTTDSILTPKNRTSSLIDKILILSYRLWQKKGENSVQILS